MRGTNDIRRVVGQLTKRLTMYGPTVFVASLNDMTILFLVISNQDTETYMYIHNKAKRKGHGSGAELAQLCSSSIPYHGQRSAAILGPRTASRQRQP